MSTLYYIQWPWGTRNTSEWNSQNTVTSIKNTINKLLEWITFTVADNQKIWDPHIHIWIVFPDISELDIKTEKDIRELLKDTHHTFILFEKWIYEAAERCKNNESVSVDLYVRDISNPDFVKTLENIKNTGINPSLLLLEIRSDDYGVLDLIAIRNLKIISQLWFHFSINDFVLDWDELDVNYLDKLTKENLIPTYIKIPKDIYTAIKNKTVKISSKIKCILDFIGSKWIQIITTSFQAVKKHNRILQDEDLWFFEKSTIKTEDILGLDGRVHIREWLIRFWDDVWVSEWLERLKHMWWTGELMKKIVQDSLPDITEDKKRAVNIYVKDLSDRFFVDKIMYMVRWIPKSKRKHLIFEILEEKYGTFNNQVLKNIQFLQREWFSIAVDDLYILNNTPECMSKEILESLIEADIYPDYIKIDGRQIDGIYKWELSSFEIGHLKEIIGYFSLLPNKPVFILEWIQNTDHAIQITNLLWRNGIEFLFQWMHIKAWEFGISKI